MTELPLDDSNTASEEGSDAAAEELFVFPLSFAQQRLWFLHQMEPASAAYNMPVAFRLSGALDVAALEWALNEIVRRHESLRTTFEVLDEHPVQLVAVAQTLTLARLDVSASPTAERESEAARLAEEEVERPFDLSHGPLLRAALLRLDAAEHVLLLTLHHIVADGWSQGVLVGELGALYAAGRVGQGSPLEEPSLQYGDFAEWQRGWLTGDVLERELAYWRRQLAGAPPSLELPTDRPRPPVQSFDGARESFALSRDLSARLAELGRREGATLFMTLLAAFKVLLSRYTGQSDIVVGTPVANRSRRELEGLVGFFVNTLVLRTDLSGDPSFRELLGRVKETSLGAYAHQDAPFEMLVEELRPVRDPSRNPLFQVMFALQNTPEPAFEESELIVSPFEVQTGRAQFDLTLDALEASGEIHCSLVYNTDLFDARTVRLLAEHFRVLLEGVAADADRALCDLPLLTAAESRRLLVEWNETRREFEEVCAHTLFEAQAARTPEAFAVVFEDQRVTYDELNRRANRVAHFLSEAGVGPESLVGLLMERSTELLVALLGILKAGGAYVPLDPNSPTARLVHLLEDARVPLLLTDRRTSARVPRQGARVICLDAEFEAISRQPDVNPPCRASADNAAYVIYTSGSTGGPKGVVVAHRGVCNLSAALAEAFAVRRESCLLQFASVGFDATVADIFTTLAVGARLCLVSRETMLSGAGLVELQREQKVTVATLPPSLLAVLSPEQWPALETMVSAGERCPAEVAARWSKGRRFVNAYGPTEATVCATVYEHDGERAGEPPIGRPISNTQVYLLDERLNLVPDGVAGELHVGGVGLARGYLGRPGLTAERFIPNPFSPEPGARLYRTGDVARRLADGNLMFLGRLDAQLKVRGFRIEPGEIEAALEEHAAVSKAAVLAREDRPGEKRLVAYVVAQPRATLTGEELRDFALQRLPEYMAPAAFVLLDELPLTLNGKLDQAALPAPQRPHAESDDGARVAPRDLLESQLADIWTELLHVEPDVRDNFFELGGHSLLAMRLLTRVEQVTGRRLDVAALFRAPTIEGLALLLRRETEAPDASPLVVLSPHGALCPIFFVHPAGGSVFSYLALARRLGAGRPVYGLEATGPQGEIESMAAVYVEAVRAAMPVGPYLLGGWSTGGVVAFEMARQLQAQGAEVALVVLLDSDAPGRGASDDAALLAGFAVNLGMSSEHLAAAPERLLRAGTQERLKWILDEARRTQLLPPDVSLRRLRSSFESYQSTVKAVENYRPPESPVPLALLRAAGTRDEVEAAAVWSRLTTLKLDVCEVPGDHLTMLREPHVSALAGILERIANECEGNRSRYHPW